MKHWIALAAVVAGGVVVLTEMYAYVTRHVSRDPFVSARRMWRRTAGIVAVVSAALLVCYYEEAAGMFESILWKLFLVLAILSLAFVAAVLALRDAYKTARIALREGALLQAESIKDFNRELRRKQQHEAKSSKNRP